MAVNSKTRRNRTQSGISFIKALSLCVILGGCASPHWVKLGAGQDSLLADDEVCTSSAARAVPEMPLDTPCDADGSYMNCSVRSARPTVGPTPAQLRAHGEANRSRSAAYDRCMTVRGWRREG